jgi:SAM-dependent methyltransferase
VTRELLSRLPQRAFDGLEAALPEYARGWWDTASEDERDGFRLALGLAHGVGDVAAHTGLRAAMPPDHVHAMSRAPEATGGSLYYGDLVVESLDAIGSPLAPGQTILDFGCSSGRVVRVLQAWKPGLRYLACDPNEPAIAWAAENLPGIEFFASPLDPPLDVPRETFDVVYAISIWSHFDWARGLAWLEEMHRVVRRGGHLLFTTHGYSSVRWFGDTGGIPLERLEAVVHDLYRTGCSFHSVFGPDGDWGVPSDGWGIGFLTAEWIAAKLTPQWEVRRFEPGAVERNQDLWLLRRT